MNGNFLQINSIRSTLYIYIGWNIFERKKTEEEYTEGRQIEKNRLNGKRNEEK